MRLPRRSKASPPLPATISHPALHYRPPPFLAALRWTLFAVVTAAILSIAYVAWWFFLAISLRGDIIAWAEQRTAEGYTASFAHLELGGFPFSLRVTAERPHLAAREGERPWSWRADRIEARLHVLSPSLVTFSSPGGHEATLILADEPHAFFGTIEQIEVTLDIRPHVPLPRFVEIKAAGGDFLDRDGARLGVGRIDLSARTAKPSDDEDNPPFYELRLDGRDLVLPATLGLPLGPSARLVAVEATMMGQLEALDLPGLTDWRDDGGTVEIHRLEVGYGPVDGRAQGTLALDARLQPIGALTARIQGFFEGVEALQQRGLIRSRDASMAKLVLGVMARRPPGGGAAVLSLPINIQDRVVFAGPVPLATLEPIDWQNLGFDVPEAEHPDIPAYGRIPGPDYESEVDPPAVKP